MGVRVGQVASTRQFGSFQLRGQPSENYERCPPLQKYANKISKHSYKFQIITLNFEFHCFKQSVFCFSVFRESYPRLSSLMHAQNCLFRAIECSNRAHSDLDKLMEALFFISGGGPAYEWQGAARRPRRAQDRRRQLRHPHRGLTGLRLGRLVRGAGTILPGCWRRSG